MSVISVIIPIYNVEKYLARCLDSVINQTYKNLEIILVNDGTKDNSVAIAEEYARKDNRIKLIHQENAGLSEARNTGLQYVTGDYVAFLDSDDWLELDAYEYLLTELEKEDADIIVGATRRTTGDKKLTLVANPKVDILTQEEYAKKYFKIGSQTIEYYVWNKLYKRKVVEGFKQPKGLYAEDVPSTFNYILNSNKILVSNKIVHNYFINQTGLSGKFSEKHFDVLKGWQMVIDMAEASGNSNYVKWANFNFKRAHFALLTELSLSNEYKENKLKFIDKINYLKSAHRKYAYELIRGPMPINRKPLATLYAIKYNLFARLINKIIRMRKG